MPFPTNIVHPSGAKLTLVPDKVLVKVAAGRTARAEDPLSKLGLVPLDDGAQRRSGPTASGEEAKADRPNAAINNSPDLVFTRTEDGKKFKPAADQTVSDDGAKWVAPVYAAEFSGTTEYLSPAADALVIPTVAADDPRNAEILAKYGLVRDEARSEYLGDYDLFTVEAGNRPAYEIRDELSKQLGTEVKLEFIPMLVPVAMNPNDPLFGSQWDMVRIGAGGSGTTGWDLQRGANTVTVAILDEGVDLNHPDLAGSFLNNGINLGTMSGTGAPTGNHGTPCAGIAAAPLDNAVGTAGVAGGARILPIAFQNWTDTEVAAGLRYARAQGARVVSMSFGWNAWDPAIIDPAIAEAHAAGMVLVAATHNHNTMNGITYPATNPLVIAVGASDQSDNRKSPASPDGEPWGSNWGPQISVVAPGVRCPAPDRTGGNGYTGNDYTMTFNGTSAATPHVAGLAALLISRKPSITNVEVRRIIETTAAKVGTVAYANTPGRPNGTWNSEMGYGRIDVLGAVRAIRRIPKFRWEDDVPVIKRWYRDFDEVIPKRIREFDKYVVEIDEVKHTGREVDDLGIDVLRDPVVQELQVRLEHLEKNMERIGAAFIDQDYRPDLDQPR
ncbi:S8 family serine peptidase [Tessaracoccus sp. OS52]|uniref:S8 family serine peptidase n=1 Tax=Tessaracoccus sp. OS52 TaxID=2886691 RepID=UPI001D0F6AD4|nr:S8 family serine peptidase [Tessaracoccus sp. OS52]MCC2594688.1 S8 family serine peptidase [Tessaracoccus sp. OS52]